MRLNDNLIDCSELEVFNQESHLLLHARELLPESEVDCPCGFEDYPQFWFCEFVVVDLHCFGY